MQIPILKGIYTDGSVDFRSAYPRNLVPVPGDTGISAGYLRPADGIVGLGTGPGVDRGGINWEEKCYRVMGSKLVRIDPDNSYTEIGDVGGTGTGQVSMAYSFDYLAISSDKKLFMCDKNLVITQVTDPDLGDCLDVVWVDGYFMSTDGDSVVVTELTDGVADPFTINPFDYGSAEFDPDPVEALVKLRNEIYVLNRYTIEVFQNVGNQGSQFPFARIEGAQIYRGCIGTHACCVFSDAVAFLGSGRNEAISIWLGLNGSSVKISTREIDKILSGYNVPTLEKVVFEVRKEEGHNQLWVRLPDQTLVYDSNVSKDAGSPAWFVLTSSLTGLSQYLAQNIVECYGKTLIAHPTLTSYGELVNTVSSHWGDEIGWDFSTIIIYAESRGAIFHELELVALSGRMAFGDESTIWTQYSVDGETWSMEKPISAGEYGDRLKRLVWFQQGHMRNWRIQRFRGTSKSYMSIARLEAQLERLNA